MYKQEQQSNSSNINSKQCYQRWLINPDSKRDDLTNLANIINVISYITYSVKGIGKGK